MMRAALVVVGFVLAVAGPASGQVSRFDELANLPFTGGFLSKGGITSLKDEVICPPGGEARDHGRHLGQPVWGFHDGQPAGVDCAKHVESALRPRMLPKNCEAK